jgi:hypothetical protein
VLRPGPAAEDPLESSFVQATDGVDHAHSATVPAAGS